MERRTAKNEFIARLDELLESSRKDRVVSDEQVERLLHRTDFDMEEFERFLDRAAKVGVEVEMPGYDECDADG